MYSSIEKDKEEKSSFVGWHRELLVGEKKRRDYLSTKTLEIIVDGVNIIMKVIVLYYYELGWYHETLVPI